MTEQITKRTTVTENVVAPPIPVTQPSILVEQPRNVTETEYQRGLPHGDEEAGGAVGGAVAGAVVGAVVAGPVGAIVGGAIGAASGATAGALDAKVKDDTTVVTREVRSS